MSAIDQPGSDENVSKGLLLKKNYSSVLVKSYILEVMMPLDLKSRMWDLMLYLGFLFRVLFQSEQRVMNEVEIYHFSSIYPTIFQD